MAKLDLNGVDIERIQALIREMQDDPHLLEKLTHSVWKSRLMWREGFQTYAFARELSPLMLDQPDWLMGDNKGFSPHEIILSALGASIAVVFVTNATALGIALESLEVEVEGRLDLPAVFGASGGSPGYEGVSVKVFVKGNAPPEVMEMLHEKALAISPVADTFRRPVKVSSTLKVL